MKSVSRWISEDLTISFVVFSLVCFGSFIKNQTARDAAAAAAFFLLLKSGELCCLVELVLLMPSIYCADSPRGSWTNSVVTEDSQINLCDIKMGLFIIF